MDRSAWSQGLWAQTQAKVGALLLMCLLIISTSQTNSGRQPKVPVRNALKRLCIFRKYWYFPIGEWCHMTVLRWGVKQSDSTSGHQGKGTYWLRSELMGLKIVQLGSSTLLKRASNVENRLLKIPFGAVCWERTLRPTHLAWSDGTCQSLCCEYDPGTRTSSAPTLR